MDITWIVLHFSKPWNSLYFQMSKRKCSFSLCRLKQTNEQNFHLMHYSPWYKFKKVLDNLLDLKRINCYFTDKHEQFSCGSNDVCHLSRCTSLPPRQSPHTWEMGMHRLRTCFPISSHRVWLSWVSVLVTSLQFPSWQHCPHLGIPWTLPLPKLLHVCNF
jgi:hypothetical protein